MFTRNQIIACVVKQYGTGLYRSFVSLNKGSTICLSTHDDEQSANETINHFWEACQKGEIKQPEDVSLFLKSITGSLGTGEMALAA
ncbi:MAG: hypothetical protein ABIU20_10595 [Blastocatellia bacterium]